MYLVAHNKKKIVKIRYPIIIRYCPWHKGTEGRKRAFLVGHSLYQGRNLTQKVLRRSHFTSHWPELVTWPLLDARGAGKVSCWNVLPQLWMGGGYSASGEGSGGRMTVGSAPLIQSLGFVLHSRSNQLVNLINGSLGWWAGRSLPS